MALELRSFYSRVGMGVTVPFGAFGGVEPYTFAVVAQDSIGGTITADGLYKAPYATGTDVVQVTDADGTVVTRKIFVGLALHLVCDIIQKYMGLANDQVFIWNQKIPPPKDERLYVAVSELTGKIFGNSNTKIPGSGLDEVISVNVFAPLDITIYGRKTDVILRKLEVVMALQSTYSKQQQELNGFGLGQVSPNIVPLNQEDGAAIPYAFNISVNLQYSARKSSAVPYFSDFQLPEIETNP